MVKFGGRQQQSLQNAYFFVWYILKVFVLTQHDSGFFHVVAPESWTVSELPKELDVTSLFVVLNLTISYKGETEL